jgi:phospholipid/cholesterol/gamma-HCH transport system substrate-binding protein
LEALPKGLKVLADQRKQLTAMLTALSNLGAVGTRVITSTKADTVANLQALAPVLSQLASAGDSLPKSFQLLLTYPFPDEAVNTMRGDYTNLYATADLDLRTVQQNLGQPGLPTVPVPGLPGVPPLPLPSLPPLPIPSLPPLLPLGPKPAPSSCIGAVCLGQGPQGSGSGSTDYSWLSLMQTGGAA